MTGQRSTRVGLLVVLTEKPRWSRRSKRDLSKKVFEVIFSNDTHQLTWYNNNIVCQLFSHNNFQTYRLDGEDRWHHWYKMNIFWERFIFLQNIHVPMLVKAISHICEAVRPPFLNQSCWSLSFAILLSRQHHSNVVPTSIIATSFTLCTQYHSLILSRWWWLRKSKSKSK